jgi:hypothetical protein
MNELVAIEDLCTTLHKEVADLKKERRERPPLRDRKFADSLLEGARFELLVPRADNAGTRLLTLDHEEFISPRARPPDLAISAGELPHAGAQTIDVWNTEQARRRKLTADLAPTSTPFLKL